MHLRYFTIQNVKNFLRVSMNLKRYFLKNKYTDTVIHNCILKVFKILVKKNVLE